MFVALSYAQMNRCARRSTPQMQAARLSAGQLRQLALHVSVRTPPGDNCFILEDNTIQPFVTIGNNVTLWSGNHIGHDSVIEDHCFITSHVVVSGHVRVGAYSFIGVNATLRNSIEIAPGTLVGAGAVIMKNTEPGRLPAAARRTVREEQRRDRTLRAGSPDAVGKAGPRPRRPGRCALGREPRRAAGGRAPRSRRAADLLLQPGRAQQGPYRIDQRIPVGWKPLGPVSADPALDLGSLGAFDDAGVTSSWIVKAHGREHLYYTGWALGVSVPFYFHVGVAARTGDGPFVRPSSAPLLDRDAVDPYLTASPCILIENGTWRMWYVSGVRWVVADGEVRHYYHIKYAESHDGVSWRRQGTVCIDFAPGEFAIARPCVVKDPDCYRMWYSYRGSRYRIGYAESKDGISWVRKDDAAGIEPSSEGWDSEMIEYPFVFDHDGQRFMLYNGNGYGRSGFGVAVWR